MPKELSAGFIIFHKGSNRLLVSHPTGNPSNGRHSWGIPKGHVEKGENPLEAALRELYEETGLEHVEDTFEIGRVPYRSDKALHLFSAYADFDIGDLHCDSKFIDSYGVEKPEVDRYRLTDDPELLFSNMYWYATRDCFLSGRRMSGSFSVADITGKVLAGSVSYKKLTLNHHNNTYIMEEVALLSPTKDG